jgi:hypothetical protein
VSGKPRKRGNAVKKAIVIPVVLVLFVLGAYLGPLLFAQAPPANVPSGTKVLIVNIRAVLKQNARAKALQAELEEVLKPNTVRIRASHSHLILCVCSKPNYQGGCDDDVARMLDVFDR